MPRNPGAFRTLTARQLTNQGRRRSVSGGGADHS
jgi:hypothetical protein